jgi:hypothetical protein
MAQGTVHGPIFRAVPPVRNGLFARAVTAQGPWYAGGGGLEEEEEEEEGQKGWRRTGGGGDA